MGRWSSLEGRRLGSQTDQYQGQNGGGPGFKGAFYKPAKTERFSRSPESKIRKEAPPKMAGLLLVEQTHRVATQQNLNALKIPPGPPKV